MRDGFVKDGVWSGLCTDVCMGRERGVSLGVVRVYCRRRRRVVSCTSLPIDGHPTLPSNHPHEQSNQAAAKAAKKGKGELLLGVGVREFKDWLLARVSSRGNEDGDSDLLAARALVSAFLRLHCCLVLRGPCKVG